MCECAEKSMQRRGQGERNQRNFPRKMISFTGATTTFNVVINDDEHDKYDDDHNDVEDN